jgi:hypothetical protein
MHITPKQQKSHRTLLNFFVNTYLYYFGHFYLTINVFYFERIRIFYKFFIWTYSLSGIFGLCYVSNEQYKINLENTYFTVNIDQTLISEFSWKTQNSQGCNLQPACIMHYNNIPDLLKVFNIYRATSKVLLSL